MSAQRRPCVQLKLSKMIICSIIVALFLRSILGITIENYSLTATDLDKSGAANVTRNRNSKDPCHNYTVLSDNWRNNNASWSGLYHCDSLLTPGKWYRLLLPAGNAIPETIPPAYSCGTEAPMWLNGAHPRYVSSTPVERQLCANFFGVPCRWSTTVHVALCSGGYYVYKAPLTTAPKCNAAWCAVDINPNQTASAICERQGNFYCSLSQNCVPYNYRCDGYSYCTYGEDEAGCANPTVPTTVSSVSCGGTFYGNKYVRSPNFPSNYIDNLNCNWTLIARPYNRLLKLQFNAFSTESCCDIVSIYNSDGSLVESYSGTTVPSTMILTNRAVIVFTTDDSLTSSGFSILFSTSDISVTTHLPRDSCELLGNFYCASSNICVEMVHRCNGYPYCSDAEDEAGCSTVAPSSTSSVTPFQRDTCSRQGKFYCEFSHDCIPMWRRCDGYSYCYYGEDESGCVNTTVTLGRGGEQPQEGYIAASGNAPLPLSNSSASELPRGSWILVSGYVTAVLSRCPRFDIFEHGV